MALLHVLTLRIESWGTKTAYHNMGAEREHADVPVLPTVVPLIVAPHNTGIAPLQSIKDLKGKEVLKLPQEKTRRKKNKRTFEQ